MAGPREPLMLCSHFFESRHIQTSDPASFLDASRWVMHAMFHCKNYSKQRPVDGHACAEPVCACCLRRRPSCSRTERRMGRCAASTVTGPACACHCVVVVTACCSKEFAVRWQHQYPYRRPCGGGW
ncbi:hypothetical protein, variant [Aphanomyces invadans]|nr:hypothetical protein, variant [Aphanomyces invadans]ETW05274.1 hypothetical protein, variant [Aphanomyces invadans]|eukprot:XP_008866711.1 hypothetical protein, variant [Aphanomyces invadans]